MDDALAYSIKTASQKADVGRSKIYEEIKAGRLRAVKLGARTLIKHNDLVAWLETLPELRDGLVE
jgi:excisionase family DNA binding protein